MLLCCVALSVDSNIRDLIPNGLKVIDVQLAIFYFIVRRIVRHNFAIILRRLRGENDLPIYFFFFFVIDMFSGKE